MRPVRRLTSLLAAGAGVAALLAGCGPHLPRLSNGAVTSCYRAIPVASGVLHAGSARVRLVGVHRVPVDTVVSHLHLPSGTLDNDTVVCAVAWKGEFAAGQVGGAKPGEHGAYAVVLVSNKQLKVITSFVTAELPAGFKGRLT